MRRLIKKQIVLFAFIIVLMLITIISSSYAAFRHSLRGGDQVIESDLLSVTYQSGSAMITGDIYAQTNTEGMAQTGYAFTINNQSTKYALDYKITIFNNPPANFSGNLVDHQYIWVGIDDQIIGKLSDLTYTTENNQRHYDLYSNLLSKNSSKTHTIKVWLDDDTPNTEGDKYIYLQIKVEGEASTGNIRELDSICVYLNSTYAATPSDHTSIGTAYSCDPGDGTYRTFYILAKDNKDVKLIMEKNLSDTVGSSAIMEWADAVAFFDSGHDGYATKQAWNKVSVDLPEADDIASASLVINSKNGWSFDVTTSTAWFCLGSHEQDEPSGPTYCPTNNSQKKAAWLFNYTIYCADEGCDYEYTTTASHAYGYWTKNQFATDSTRVWRVYRHGYLDNIIATNNSSGVRPVIKISLNELGDSMNTTKKATQVCQFISGTYGAKGEIGAKYSCDLGDSVSRNFYILAKDKGKVKLIMDRNITDSVGSNATITWDDAMAFFDSGNPGYATAQSWTNVISIDLPDASTIAAAVNYKTWDVSTTTNNSWWCLGSHAQDEPSGPTYCTTAAQAKYAWLYDYTKDCVVHGCVNEYTMNINDAGYSCGYWTSTLQNNNSSRAWNVVSNGDLATNAIYYTAVSGRGLRPVITIYESNLYE